MGHYASEMNGESDQYSDYLKERLEKMSKWVLPPKFEVQQFGKFFAKMLMSDMILTCIFG